MESRKESFKNAVVIITGASAGIGRSLAIQLAGQGAKVVLVARQKERLEEVAGVCQKAGGIYQYRLGEPACA